MDHFVLFVIIHTAMTKPCTTELNTRIWIHPEITFIFALQNYKNMLRNLNLSDVLHETLTKLDGNGILLLAGDPPNPMTIGWGTIGPIWGRQVFTVLVRPTRYTFGLMENTKDFTVCVLPDGFRKQLAVCGTRSGRDIDKLSACNFVTLPCVQAQAQYIKSSEYHFECRIIHKHRIDADTLEPAIIERYYPIRDFHMIYYGEILGIYGK